MDKPSKSEPALKLIKENDVQEPSEANEEIAVLRPDTEASAFAKIEASDVSDLMPGDDEEEEDPEALWGKITGIPPVGGLVLAGLILCGIGIWAAVTLFKAQPVIEATKLEKRELLVERENKHKENKKILLSMEESVRGYLAADSIETLLPFVRHQDRVKPLMAEYYSQRKLQPVEFLRFNRIRSMGLENLPFVYGKVSLTDGGSRNLLIEELEDGAFRVDWESDVCYQPMPWSQYITQRPKNAMNMRVKITPDTFYAYEFKDESRFQCYKITTRNSDEHLFGYVIKNSQTAREINKLLLKSRQYGGGKNEPMILRLSFPEKTNTKRAVSIDSLLAPRWTYVNPPEQNTPPAK